MTTINSKQIIEWVQLSFWNLAVDLLSESPVIQTLYRRTFVFLRWYLLRSVVIQLALICLFGAGSGIILGYLFGLII